MRQCIVRVVELPAAAAATGADAAWNIYCTLAVRPAGVVTVNHTLRPTTTDRPSARKNTRPTSGVRYIEATACYMIAGASPVPHYRIAPPRPDNLPAKIRPARRPPGGDFYGAVNILIYVKKCSVYIQCKGDIVVVDIKQHKSQFTNSNFTITQLAKFF